MQEESQQARTRAHGTATHPPSDWQTSPRPHAQPHTARTRKHHLPGRGAEPCTNTPHHYTPSHNPTVTPHPTTPQIRHCTPLPGKTGPKQGENRRSRRLGPRKATRQRSRRKREPMATPQRTQEAIRPGGRAEAGRNRLKPSHVTRLPCHQTAPTSPSLSTTDIHGQTRPHSRRRTASRRHLHMSRLN